MLVLLFFFPSTQWETNLNCERALNSDLPFLYVRMNGLTDKNCITSQNFALSNDKYGGAQIQS